MNLSLIISCDITACAPYGQECHCLPWLPIRQASCKGIPSPPVRDHHLANGSLPTMARPSVASSVYCSSSFCATPLAMAVMVTPVSCNLR